MGSNPVGVTTEKKKERNEAYRTIGRDRLDRSGPAMRTRTYVAHTRNENSLRELVDSVYRRHGERVLNYSASKTSDGCWHLVYTVAEPQDLDGTPPTFPCS